MEKTPEDFTRNADAAIYGRRSTFTPKGVVMHESSFLKVAHKCALAAMAVVVAMSVMYPSIEGGNRFGHQVQEDAMSTALEMDAHAQATTAADNLMKQRISPIDQVMIRAQAGNAAYHLEEIDFKGLVSMSSIPVHVDLNNLVTPTPSPRF